MSTVLLALTESGLAAARRIATTADTVVWCDARAISDEQFEELEASTVTRFAHAVEGDEAIDDALHTIEQHHPGSTVFVEANLR